MKTFLIVLALLGVGALLYVGFTTSEEQGIAITGEPTNFVKVGTIEVATSTSAQGALYLVYPNEGGPETKIELTLDGESICATSTGATPCMAMSVTFDIPFHGRRAMVEGIEAEGSVTIRKLTRLEEGQPELIVDPGTIYIPWPKAIELLRQCQVEFAMQTHSLDVNLTLKEGTHVRSVEPVIDELFRIYDEVQTACGPMPIATE